MGRGGRDGACLLESRRFAMRVVLSVRFGPQIAMPILSWRLTYIHERKWSMQQPERAIDGSIKPRVVPTRAESDEVLLALDVLLFRIVQRIVVLNIVPHAAVFGLGRPARRK